MAKASPDITIDPALAATAGATLMTVCSAQPTTRAQAITTFKLADVVMAGADFAIANGDVSGRKVTVAQKADVPIDTTGTATHVALVNATALLDVTTTTSQALTAGGTVTIPVWKREIADPV